MAIVPESPHRADAIQDATHHLVAAIQEAMRAGLVPAAPRPAGVAPALARVPRSYYDVIADLAQHPTWGEPVYEANFIAALAALAPFTQILSYQVPPGQCGLVDGFANGVTNRPDWDNLVWQIRVDDAAVLGFDDIRGQIGAIPLLAPVYIPLLPGQVLSGWVRNLSAAIITNPTVAFTGRVVVYPIEVGEP